MDYSQRALKLGDDTSMIQSQIIDVAPIPSKRLDHFLQRSEENRKESSLYTNASPSKLRSKKGKKKKKKTSLKAVK